MRYLIRELYRHIKRCCEPGEKQRKTNQLDEAHPAISVLGHPPKAASEIASLEDVGKLLGNADKQIAHKAYRRVGKVVKATQ